MDQTHKFLKKLDKKRRLIIEFILEKLHEKDFSDLDIKKLKASNLFRVRKGSIRIIYSISERDEINIIKIEFRSENTY